MKIIEGKEQEHAAYVAKNQDPYGSGVIRFSNRWAELMEDQLSTAGQNLKDIAQSASEAADTEGISGFMYGCAVSELAYFWQYGEELRRWHNLRTQIRHEGEKANESGGVLNPALLTIQTER